eukprot:Nitzschia sp. Nitz4//scaffold63_size106090//99706//101733//NITZ4_004417-RA/size106090-augustus-gene-0.164-mRNA-1//1//CDS//3329556056//5234//frame0
MPSSTDEPLINVSPYHIILTIIPLLVVAAASWKLELELESPILVGILRTYVQLNILSMLLNPVFAWGISLWWVVVGYVMFMVLLASFEASNRSKYYFKGMFWWVLGTLLANVLGVALFAFGLILQPTPLWSPTYVIPIMGMLLGNCINGISLSLNTLLNSFVEVSREIDLLLAFGATSYEASTRLLKEAVRTGTMPQLNGMAIIGLISIPGMMTGQILGGSPVMEAARYQILIMYLIAMCTFGTILCLLHLVLGVCFDAGMILKTDFLHRRETKRSALAVVRSWWEAWQGSPSDCQWKDILQTSSTSLAATIEERTQLTPQGKIAITTSNGSDTTGNKPILVVRDVTYSFEKPQDEVEPEMEDASTKRVLFTDLSFEACAGGTVLVNGPSGVGKSTLLRILAGLTIPDQGSIGLNGTYLSKKVDMPMWRKQVLYVPQTKVDIPGTPKQLIAKITTFKAWSRVEAPTYSDVKSTTVKLVREWGMNSSLLESEWKELSGGESQRVLVAISLATRPKVILLDESTSALDVQAKLRVERSVEEFCSKSDMCAIWITHDQGQKERVFMSQD